MRQFCNLALAIAIDRVGSGLGADVHNLRLANSGVG
jgi:hypothetical protein